MNTERFSETSSPIVDCNCTKVKTCTARDWRFQLPRKWSTLPSKLKRIVTETSCFLYELDALSCPFYNSPVRSGSSSFQLQVIFRSFSC